MKNLYKAFLISLSLFAFNATADMYVGGGVYTSEVKDTIDGVKIDDDDTVPAIFLGWKPISFLAVEAGYYDLGDFSAGSFDGDASALTVGVVANIPLWILDVYAKGGLAYVDYDIAGDSDSDADPYYGVGAAINLGGSIDVYAEYLVFDSVVDFDMLGLGVRFQF